MFSLTIPCISRELVFVVDFMRQSSLIFTNDLWVSKDAVFSDDLWVSNDAICAYHFMCHP
jgi:hypothetical protein